MQFWDQRQTQSGAPGNSRFRSDTDSNNLESVQQTEDQLAEDQQEAEHRFPSAGAQRTSVGISDHNQPGGSAYVLDSTFAQPPGVGGDGGVSGEDADTLAKGLQQVDHPRQASGFYNTHNCLFSYQAAEQSSREILTRKLEAAAETNSQAAAAACNANLYFSAPTLSGSTRFNPYVFHHRQSQQGYEATGYGFDAGATAVEEPKSQVFGEAASYGSTGGALSLQQQFLAGAEVGSNEMRSVVDQSSWRIQGTGGAQPESASPTASSGEKSDRRKRKFEADETSAKPYACRFCSQSFEKSQALGGHMNRHRQEREREQLDNAQKLVLKQQSLQSLSGLPLQNQDSRAKSQCPSPIVSLDQVTFSRYNQPVQYQHPRTFLTGTGIHANLYSTLHSSPLLNAPGTWNNLRSYFGGGTASLSSGSSMSQLEPSGRSNLARVVSGATPEDLFAASVLESAASPQIGRSGETTENHAEPEMMYGYPGVSEARTSGPETSSCQQFNFSNVRQSFETVPQAVGNVQLYRARDLSPPGR